MLYFQYIEFGGRKMLIFDFVKIGNRLYSIRKKLGLTQSDVAEKAEISDRTYADIERGSVNMRIETFLKICNVLNASPNDILVENNVAQICKEDLIKKIDTLSLKNQETILQLIDLYIKSI